jgi:hypothetical protein
VFPDSNDAPTGILQDEIRFSVPLSVSLDLGSPKIGVLARGPVVLGAAMPVAAINEDGDPGSGEDNVGCTTQLRYRAS